MRISGVRASAASSSMRPGRGPPTSTSPTMIRPFPSPRLRSVNRPALLTLTGAGLFLAALDAYVVVTVLVNSADPRASILTSLNIPVNHFERATPIITGFLLGYLAAMPLAGGLTDRFGRLRVFALSLVLFAFASFL